MPDFTASLIDHLNVSVTDLSRSVAFYTAALAPLGVGTTMSVPADPSTGQRPMHGFGWHHKPFLWLVEGGQPGPDTHIGLTAPDQETVRAFYAAALAAGATTRRAPGYCPEYHPGYYGAFVNDPDGINLEAVHHGDPSGDAS